MSIENHTGAPGANVHTEHYCDHEDAAGIRCKAWGCYGFEESKTITLWYCKHHQPPVYKGFRAHGLIRQ